MCTGGGRGGRRIFVVGSVMGALLLLMPLLLMMLLLMPLLLTPELEAAADEKLACRGFKPYDVAELGLLSGSCVGVLIVLCRPQTQENLLLPLLSRYRPLLS